MAPAMLNDKLEQASKQAAARTRKIVLAAGAGMVMVAVGLIAVTLLLGRPEPSADLPPAAAVQPPPAPPVTPDAEPLQLPTPPPAPPPTRAAVPEPDNTAAREAFKAALKDYTRTIEPLIAEPRFAAWDAAAQRQVAAHIEGATTAFSKGDYAGAQSELDRGVALAQDRLQARDAAFADAMAAASLAKQADDYDAGLLNISEALRLDPDSAAAQALAAEIEGLPEILKLAHAAAVARTENNPEAEHEILSQLLKLDPMRPGVRERAEETARLVREIRFAGFIGEVLAGLEARDLTRAQTGLAGARQVYPDREELTLLGNRVTALGRDLETERLLREASAAAARDSWGAALDLYARALAIQPNNQDIAAGHARAGEIAALDTQLTQMLAAPKRLASPNIARAAAQAAVRARGFAQHSPSLAGKAETLETSLARYNNKLPVRIVSDGATSISVRGVGQVGLTTGRTIELKPGSYLFEGKRAGFRSKLVAVEVSPDSGPIEVTVLCDEPV